MTLLPTASTRPATSVPRTLRFGLRSPTAGRAMYGLPVIAYQSAGFTEDACTRISTPSSATSGCSISRNSGEPYRSHKIAFIAFC